MQIASCQKNAAAVGSRRPRQGGATARPFQCSHVMSQKFAQLLRRLVCAFVPFAVYPCVVQATTLREIGAVAKAERTPSGLELTCADGSHAWISVLAPDLVRVRAVFAGQSGQPDASWAIARDRWPACPWTLAETADSFRLTTSAVEVVIHRKPFLIEFRDAATHAVINADERPMARDAATGEVAVYKSLGLDEHFYGLGEKAARLDRRRGAFTLWNSDTPGYSEGTDPLYQSIPFYIGWERGRAYGLFYDNPCRSAFDFGHTGQEYAGYTASGGDINYYFFSGPSMKGILGRYADLTGHMPLPPLWALGNQQSRYSYYPDTMVEQIARTYRAHDLPLDVLYLDIHYMNGYRSFTWDPKRFPDPKRLMDGLRKLGVKVVTIVDPGIKYQPPAPGAPPVSAEPDRGSQKDRYYVFDEGLKHNYFLRRRDGSLYVGEVWPGKAVFVDYTRADARRWWGDLHKRFLDEGVAGFWNDMNEPSDFVDKSGASQADVMFGKPGHQTSYASNRNTFALNMDRATFEGLERNAPGRRPFVLTRAGYAGVQRYATMWTGDNKASWKSLRLNIPMFASLGLSGEPFVGSDVPGFIGRSGAEMLARSYELAFLVPLCRNHAAIDDYDHEPWRFGSYAEGIVRKYLKLRYQLLPYLYTVLEEAHRTGVPFFRPLLLNFQTDSNLLTVDDEFMVGGALLAAPVLRPAQRERELYLPEGVWYDFWTGARTAGGQTIAVNVPLDAVPLYVRGGAVLPSTVAMDYVGEKPWDPIRFDVYPDANGAASGSLYEDDGTSTNYLAGQSRRTELSCGRAGSGYRIALSAPQGSYRPGARTFEIIVHGVAAGAVTLDGTALAQGHAGATGAGWWRSADGTTTVRLSDDSAAHAIELR